jgi:hypothetical protein
LDKEHESISYSVSKGAQEGQKSDNSLSRREFLKTLGAVGLASAAGVVGIAGYDKLLNRPASAIHIPAAPQQPFAWIIYRSGSETFAQKDDGSPPIHDPSPEVVIQTVLNDPGPFGSPQGPGHIHIRRGIYDLSSSFQGFNVRSYTTITLDPQARIRVPNGYAGYAFKLESSGMTDATGCNIDGGEIAEVPTPQRQWTAILLNGTGVGAGTPGVLFNKFTNITIRSAKMGIQLQAVSDPNPSDPAMQGIWGGWVNGNLFEFIKMWDCQTFIDFNMINAYTPDTQITGIHRNRFLNIECQCTPNTAHGVRNIRHFGNSFINVNIWDVPPGATISSVHLDSRGTIIISGIMTGPSFVDQGRSTKIMDEINGPFL